MKTNVYVDGFNFYYGCFKNPNYPQDKYCKWLDLATFLNVALPRDQINLIRYFTALVSPQTPQKRYRQESYVRTLRTIPNLTVHEGHFLTTRKTGRVVDGNRHVTNHLQEIEVREEKGSDVNIATHLLVDAFDKDFELAVIVSNDSDLVGPIEVVRKRFGLQVGVLNPQSGYSRALARTATFYKKIPRSELPNCQFPDQMTDAGGVFYKPPRWSKP